MHRTTYRISSLCDVFYYEPSDGLVIDLPHILTMYIRILFTLQPQYNIMSVHIHFDIPAAMYEHMYAYTICV